MKMRNSFITFQIPDTWVAEEDDDAILNIYDPNGLGASTLSFFRLSKSVGSIDEQSDHMAETFINRNKITLDAPLRSESDSGKRTIIGSGTFEDGSYVKLWVITVLARVVVASYFAKEKTAEVDDVDEIIESIKFRIEWFHEG